MKHIRIVLVLALVVLAACDTHKSGDEHNHGEKHKKDTVQDKDDHKDHDHDEKGGRDKGENGHGEEEGGHGEGIVLSKRAIERSDIKTQSVRSQALTSTFSTIAEIELDPSKVAHISPLVQSRVLSVYAFEGQRVTTKSKLLKLQSIDLRVAQASLQQARANTAAALKDYQRSQQLNRQDILSGRALNEAQRKYQVAKAKESAARMSVRLLSEQTTSGGHAIIKSPIDGVVLERHATIGEVIKSEDITFKIADTSRVWVIGQVFEQDAAKIALGQKVVVTLQAYPGETWIGVIEHIHPVLREDTHSIPIRVVLENTKGQLKPGMFGSLHIQLKSNAQESPVVPDEAIQVIKGQDVIFVQEPSSNRFEKRVVTLGVRQSGFVEVTKGVNVGERVVVNGSFILKSHLLREELGHGHAH